MNRYTFSIRKDKFMADCNTMLVNHDRQLVQNAHDDELRYFRETEIMFRSWFQRVWSNVVIEFYE